MIISIYHEGALGKVLTSRPIKGDNDEIVHASGFFFFFLSKMNQFLLFSASNA